VTRYFPPPVIACVCNRAPRYGAYDAKRFSRVRIGTLADTLAKAFPFSRLAAVSSYETIDGEDAICTPTNGGGQRAYQTGRFPR
jgi:hypothetical protein